MTRHAMPLLLACVLLGAENGSALAQEAEGTDSLLVTPLAVPATAPAGIAVAPAVHAERSGSQALAVGLTSTLGPIVLGALLFPAQEDGQNGASGVALGAAVGVLAGPAIGLASGGRGDLAGRGLLIRGSMYLLFGLSAAAITSGNDGDSLESLGGIAVLGLVMGGVAVISAAHDLAVTPGAVTKGRPVSLSPVADPRGHVGVMVRF